MVWLAVGIGGALGAPLRFVTDRWVQERRFGDDELTAWPLGTLAVNVIGGLMLGVIVGASRYGTLGAVPVAVMGTGFCGALTTFSTASVETIRLAEADRWPAALAVAASNLLLTMTAAALGLGLIVAIW